MRNLTNAGGRYSGSQSGLRKKRRTLCFPAMIEPLEGRALLTLVPSGSYATGSYPAAIASADFDVDGKIDMAVANSGADSVRVLFGNGDGAFDSGRTFATGSQPVWIGTGDFDADGKIDLFSVNYGTLEMTNPGFSFLKGNGDGTFQAPRNTAASSPPISTPWGNLDSGRPNDAVIHDFDLDGDLDVAISLTGISDQYFGDENGFYYYEGRPAEFQTFLGNGNGTFTAGMTGAFNGYEGPAIEKGDINGDGKIDLILGATGFQPTIRLGNGDGTFQASILVNQLQQSGSLKTGDFDGNGTMDLATADYNGITVTSGNGNGTFGPARSYSNVIHKHLATADFDGDGTLDLAAIKGSSSIEVFLGKGDGTFQAPRSYGTGALLAATLAVDIDADGLPEMIAADSVMGGVRIFENTGDWRTFTVSGVPASIQAGVPFTITFTARDADGALIPGYTGTVRLTSSDPLATMPAEYTFTPADNGTKTFQVTLRSSSSEHTIKLTDIAAAGFSGQVTGLRPAPGAVSELRINYIGSPVEAVVEQWAYFQIQAIDAFGFPTVYGDGTLRFTSSDPNALLPGDTYFGEYELDNTYLTAVFRNSGFQSLTVHDVADPSIRGTLGPIRVIPVATVDAPAAALRNRPVEVTLGAIGLPTGTSASFAIDWDSDGVIDRTVIGPVGTKISHAFPSARYYEISVTVTAQIGGMTFVSVPGTDSIFVSGATVTLGTDPADTVRKALFVQGTDETDYFSVVPAVANGVELFVFGSSVGTFADPSGARLGRVYLYGNGGDDYLDAGPAMTSPVYFFGGDGNDSIIASASTTDNVMIGGAGDDSIEGGSGRNLLIGGTGADTIAGGGGEDILIPGTTSFDTHLVALASLMKEWSRTDTNYATRVKRLNSSQTGGLNGSYRLTSRTVFDDGVIDILFGNGNLDWFFRRNSGRNRDVVRDLATGEVATNL